MGRCWACLVYVVLFVTLFEYYVDKTSRGICSWFWEEQEMYLKMGDSELDPNASIVWNHIQNLNMMLAQSRIYSYKFLFSV